MTASLSKTVFTPVEVAQVLRVTSETIRRKIISGELGAIEVGGEKRKQYRITFSDLSRWLGPERSAQLFGADAGIHALGEALAKADDHYFEEELPEMIQKVRAERRLPASDAYLPTPTPKEIQRKFGKK
ncbi:hypothetical protein Dxin01_03859 [Deinococcus xinjiangensis]|uniref:Helix-turn-helix domain-containing protein n=1 Tax=Deinococcus xinjiangensis TaxID=457454 RepID=A0ABP9VFS7_9DEIO